MFKTILKYSFLVCAVLMLGQFEIDRRALGNHFVTGVKSLSVWSMEQLSATPWVVKLLNPKDLGKWFPIGEMGQSKSSIREIRAGIGSDDSWEMEDSDDEDSEINESLAVEKEKGSEDAAIMAILP
ncbi:MAG: hypothetical protein ACKOA8_18175 [Deltaproteobacteria bacterium]